MGGEVRHGGIGEFREKLIQWWEIRPLGVTFTVYLSIYLVAATVISAGLVDVLSTWYEGCYEVELELNDGTVQAGPIDSGPYIYDPVSDELIPASELDLPGDGPYAVFIATGTWGTGSAVVPEGGRTISTLYASIEQVRNGEVRLYDWGMNYNENYPQEEVLGDGAEIPAGSIEEYDKRSRSLRAQSVDLFRQMTGSDLEETFGANLVSNTAYYATAARPTGVFPQALLVMNGLAPIVVFGGLGWVMFRTFYRAHIAEPLGSLECAADRIACQDLDFRIDRARGKELARLSVTLENMRASLLNAQRELWRTAEGRRRLNAAFAHDMRTPITVLKGTVEIAQVRLDRGEVPDERWLETLSSNVSRLERYVQAMSGLSKLEDRTVEYGEVALEALVDELFQHGREVVSARAPEFKLLCVDCLDDLERTRRVPADVSLMEEVIDNLLGNACDYASRCIEMRVDVSGDALLVEVRDDGPGFSHNALCRGAEPFYSEKKSSEHFGLGLNVSNTLCGLHGGWLSLTNVEGAGACVTAVFGISCQMCSGD